MKRRTQQKSPAKTTSDGILKVMRSRVARQAALAVFTIVVTVVLLFAMTTAWYTNVVETGGLTFEAESWGFDGDVVLQERAITAAPGDSGVVYMSVTNNSDSISSVTVNVSKDYMEPEELQQRIFFYIDEQATVNNETMSRRYLSNTSGYTYTLFGQNSLQISDKIYTHPRLKWMWVYDVVGYYFRGTVTEEGVVVDEYLRPVEYNYDNATYDEDGNLLTVDGTTDVGTFLSQITAVDGFNGKYSYNANNVLVNRNGEVATPVHGCYHIANIDDQKIWLRLCTKQEIEDNTRWDTQFGAAAADGSSGKFQARISISGQQISQDAVTVNTPSDLASAMLTANGGIVRLESSMVLSESLKMYSQNSAFLDLNGHALTYTGEGYAFTVDQGAELTVINGTIQGDNAEENSSAFYTIGGQLTLSNVTIDDMYMAVNIEDHRSASSQGANSCVRIVGSDITTGDISIKINGDGSLSGEQTYLVIQDSTVSSEGYVGIMGNGNTSNPGNWGTDIQVVNSEIYGYYAGVYHPQQYSNLTVSDSKVAGITGMAIKGGNVYITDSTVKGLGLAEQITTPAEDSLSKSGFTDSGDGIYVETNYEKPIKVEITGDKTYVSSVADGTYAVRVFPEANYVTVSITGGTYSSYVVEFVPSNYSCKLQGDTNYVVSD